MNSKRDILTYEVNRRIKLMSTRELDHVSVALDVGTGDGFSALALLSVSDQVIAVDKDWTHLREYALPRSKGKQVFMVQGDFAHLPVHAIDLYCSFDSWRQALLHQSSTELLKQVIREASESLKTHGILLCVERLAFFDDWQPQNRFQRNRKVYYSIVEHLFNPQIFDRALLSRGTFLDIIKNYFQILTVHTVYERAVLKEPFFESVKEMDPGEQCQRHLKFLTQNPKIEDPMIRLVAQKPQENYI
jgi:SAM-dependent methyltransferase